jgi:hypothetical protein
MTKRILNIFFFALLVVPAIQYFSRIIPEPGLHNVPVERRFPKASKESLLSVKFQNSLERWLIQNTGLFGGMVYLQNSINYHLFHTASSDPTKGSLMGNERSLFDRIYVNDLNGRYRSTPLTPEVIAERLKRMQDFLQANGKQFLFVIHPNKALFQPEWVPSSFRIGRSRPRFMDQLRPALDKLDVNYLEVGTKFDPAVSYFPKSGAHLSYYGMCVGTREVVKALAQKAPKLFPEFECVRKASDRAPKENELDLTDLLNAWGLYPSQAAVPDFTMEVSRPVVPKLKVLFSGTSYVFGLMKVFDELKAFAQTDFLFYEKSLYSYSKDSTERDRRAPHPVNNKKHLSLAYLLSHDLVIFESTDARVFQVGGKILHKFKDNERIERFYERIQKN